MSLQAQHIPIQFALTDSSGIEIPNKSVNIRASLTTDTAAFNPEYQETHIVVTNKFGIASFWLGSGISTSLSVQSEVNVSWLNPALTYYIKLEIDSAGTGYSDFVIIPYRFSLVSVQANYADTSNYSLISDSSHYSIESDFSTRSDYSDSSYSSVYADSSHFSLLSEFSHFSTTSDSSELAYRAERSFFSDTSGFALNISLDAFKDSSTSNELQSLKQVLEIDSNAHDKSIVNLKSVTIGDSLTNESAALAINSSQSGLLLPRMTKTQRDIIQNPLQGLMVYCTDCENDGRVSIFDGNTWETLMQTSSAGNPPVITTGPVEGIGIGTATFNSSILDSGDTQIFSSGFCWGLTPYPTISDFIGTANLIDSNGILKGNIFGLDSNTTYYVRAYASNGAGTTYGPMVTFKTEGTRYLGENFQGGYVGYLFKPGDVGFIQGEQHGIIICPIDYPNLRPFGVTGCFNNDFYYDFPERNTLAYVTDSTKINDNIGFAFWNHEILMATSICASQPHLPSVIDTLKWNGYHDWVLPTFRDLEAVFNNIEIIDSTSDNGFTKPLSNYYHTSCTNGPYNPNKQNATEKVVGVKYTTVSSGYPNFTTSTVVSSSLRWYGSNMYIRLIRYF